RRLPEAATTANHLDTARCSAFSRGLADGVRCRESRRGGRCNRRRRSGLDTGGRRRRIADHTVVARRGSRGEASWLTPSGVIMTVMTDKTDRPTPVRKRMKTQAAMNADITVGQLEDVL